MASTANKGKLLDLVHMRDDIPGRFPILRCTFLATGFSTDAVKRLKAPEFTKKTSIR